MSFHELDPGDFSTKELPGFRYIDVDGDYIDVFFELTPKDGPQFVFRASSPGYDNSDAVLAYVAPDDMVDFITRLAEFTGRANAWLKKLV